MTEGHACRPWRVCTMICGGIGSRLCRLYRCDGECGTRAGVRDAISPSEFYGGAYLLGQCGGGPGGRLATLCGGQEVCCHASTAYTATCAAHESRPGIG